MPSDAERFQALVYTACPAGVEGEGPDEHGIVTTRKALSGFHGLAHRGYRVGDQQQAIAATV